MKAVLLLALVAGCELYVKDAKSDAPMVDAAPDAWQPSAACEECCGKISLEPTTLRRCVMGDGPACQAVCRPVDAGVN